MKHKQNQAAVTVGEPDQSSSAKHTVKLTRASVVLYALIIIVVAFVAGTRSQELYAAIGGWFGVDTEAATLDNRQLQRVYRELLDNYDGKLDADELSDGAAQGMVRAVGDPYTEFLSGSAASEFEDSLAGIVGGGVGIEISLRHSQPTVVRTLPDNPAEKSGIKAGDTLLAVNDESVEGQSVDVVAAKIRGEAGTSVVLKVDRDGVTKSFTMTREEVNNPSVTSRVKDGIGIVTLYRFDNQTGALTRKAAQKFKDQHVKGVILDIRNNGGGYLNAAVDVAGVWLDNQPVVSEKADGRTIEELKSGRNPVLKGVPTVVLVNEFSASASEIVAGALKDHKVATLIGDTTYGKGTVQRVIDLPSGAILRVTVAHWYTPNGHGINKKGIKPHQSVKLSKSDVDNGRDPQLKAALDYLSK